MDGTIAVAMVNRVNSVADSISQVHRDGVAEDHSQVLHAHNRLALTLD